MVRNDSATVSDARDARVSHPCVLRAVATGRFEAGTYKRASLSTILRSRHHSGYTRIRPEQRDFYGAFTSALSIKPDHDDRLACKIFLITCEPLPVEQREALILIGSSGFPYSKTAEMSGAALGTVKRCVSRARQRPIELLGLREDVSLELTDNQTMAVIVCSRNLH